MKDYIEERAVEIANYIVENKVTVRQAAKKFGVSKSTVHKDACAIIKLIKETLINRGFRRLIHIFRDVFYQCMPVHLNESAKCKRE